jgi:hypothetical protein
MTLVGARLSWGIPKIPSSNLVGEDQTPTSLILSFAEEPLLDDGYGPAASVTTPVTSIEREAEPEPEATGRSYLS